MTKRKASVALDTGTESNQSNSTQDNNSNSTSTNIIVPSSNSNSTTAQHGPSSITDQQADCGQEQVAGSNADYTGQRQPKSKKERSDNWSTAEITILHRGIECRRDIFYGPPSQATKKNRELAWEAITKEVNSVSTTPRTLSQVMKKFKNEKCRAKRKFVEHDKEGLNSSANTNLSNGNSVNSNDNNTSANNINSGNHTSNNNGSSSNNSNNNNNTNANNNTTNDTDLTSQSHAISNQLQLSTQQRPPHHLHHHQITGVDSMAAQPSINVVKLAPQNVAKTMIDLPGHVQQIQMPNDDMVLIVPPEMDGLLSGMNIVSDGTGHHHFQKCSSNTTAHNHQHNHQAQQHALQTINTGQGLVGGTMGNGMMARTIPAGSMCSLVYSTGNEICGAEPVAGAINSQPQLPSGQLGGTTHNLLHHRAALDPSQGQHQHQHHQNHHHHLHQQHQQQAPHQQPQQQQASHQQQHQSQQPQPQQHPTQQTLQHQAQHTQQQNSMTAVASLSASNINNGNGISNSNSNSSNNNNGLQVESQLKNLLFNLLLKEGSQAAPEFFEANQDSTKQRNEILALIASSLTKIESHLESISKVTSSYFARNPDASTSAETNDAVSAISNHGQRSSHSGATTSDGNNNNIGMTSSGDN